MNLISALFVLATSAHASSVGLAMDWCHPVNPHCCKEEWPTYPTSPWCEDGVPWCEHGDLPDCDMLSPKERVSCACTYI